MARFVETPAGGPDKVIVEGPREDVRLCEAGPIVGAVVYDDTPHFKDALGARWPWHAFPIDGSMGRSFEERQGAVNHLTDRYLRRRAREGAR